MALEKQFSCTLLQGLKKQVRANLFFLKNNELAWSFKKRIHKSWQKQLQKTSPLDPKTLVFPKKRLGKKSMKAFSGHHYLKKKIFLHDSYLVEKKGDSP